MRTTSMSLIIIIILFFTTGSYSQNLKHKCSKQGTWETGGELFFSTSSEEYSETGTVNHDGINTYTNFQLSANAGYFIINGLKLGFEPALEVTDLFGHTDTQLKIYFTPEYVLDIKTNYYPFVSAAVGYLSYSPAYSSTGDGFTWGVKGGVKINAAGNSLLAIALRYYEENYNTLYSIYGSRQKSKQIGISAGWSVFF